MREFPQKNRIYKKNKIKTTELKNDEIRNVINGLNGRLYLVEEGIKEMEDKFGENIHIKTEEETNKQKNTKYRGKNQTRDIWDKL